MQEPKNKLDAEQNGKSELPSEQPREMIHESSEKSGKPKDKPFPFPEGDVKP
jgi:hypothetical protein